MIRLLWVFAWAGVAVWSLFAFAAYGLVDVLGGFAARHADAVSNHPETVETLFTMLNGLKSFGLGAILVVWGLVSLSILGVPWFLGRAARGPGGDGAAMRFPGRSGRVAPLPEPEPRRARPDVIDLAPDQYASDRQQGGRPRADEPPPNGGAVPRVGRRN